MEKRDTPLRTRNDVLEYGRELVIKFCIGESLSLFLPAKDKSDLSDNVQRNDKPKINRDHALSKVCTTLGKLNEPKLFYVLSFLTTSNSENGTLIQAKIHMHTRTPNFLIALSKERSTS